MDERGRRVRAEQLHQDARNIRGRFLNLVAVIERDTAIILTEYFCTNDDELRKLFFEKVAERISLQRKKEILVEIVKRDYPRYWDENKRFLNELQNIQDFRNKLAHSVIDVSDEALLRSRGEGVGFIQWGKDKPITNVDLNDWEVRANMVISTLSDIKRLLPFKEVPVA